MKALPTAATTKSQRFRLGDLVGQETPLHVGGIRNPSQQPRPISALLRHDRARSPDPTVKRTLINPKGGFEVLHSTCETEYLPPMSGLISVHVEYRLTV